MTGHLVFLLEERSAKEMLDGLLPRILKGAVSYRCLVFEGKQDLERQLVQRIRHYRMPHTPVCRAQGSGQRRLPSDQTETDGFVLSCRLY